MNYGKRLLIMLGAVLVIAGVVFVVQTWKRGEDSDNPNIVTIAPPETSSAEVVATTVSTAATNASLEDLKERIDLSLKPDELGEIMILMYHRIGDEDLEYDRSVASFKRDLQELYDRGFRSVSMSDYINSRFEVPAGTTPVVFTFDDGDPTHFKIAFDSKGMPIPDPSCAVGILDAFFREHPDFGRNAIFYLNAAAFGEPEHLEWKLRYLHENGYEIGNHTYGHDFLNQLSAAEVQETIGRNAKYYKRLHDKAEMRSLALPYGIAPEGDSEALAVSGEYDGVPYRHDAVLLVGWRPTWPLYIKGLNPAGINRVQSGDMELQMWWWLDVYEEHPENRFISDGVPEIITIPESRRGDADMEKVDENRLYFYDPQL